MGLRISNDPPSAARAEHHDDADKQMEDATAHDLSPGFAAAIAREPV